MKNNYKIRGTNQKVEKVARKLRKNLTPTEADLWEKFRNKVYGLAT